jgi:hypothetical protein
VIKVGLVRLLRASGSEVGCQQEPPRNAKEIWSCLRLLDTETREVNDCTRYDVYTLTGGARIGTLAQEG